MYFTDTEDARLPAIGSLTDAETEISTFMDCYSTPKHAATVNYVALEELEKQGARHSDSRCNPIAYKLCCPDLSVWHRESASIQIIILGTPI